MAKIAYGFIPSFFILMLLRISGHLVVSHTNTERWHFMLSHEPICALNCGNLDKLVMVLINFCYTAIAELLDNAIDEVLIRIISIKIVLPPFEITRHILFH
jgi:hypothetical protein